MNLLELEDETLILALWRLQCYDLQALIFDLLVIGLALILMVLIAGFVGLALLNVISFNEALANLIQQWTQMETSVGVIARLQNYSTTTSCEDPSGKIVQC